MRAPLATATAVLLLAGLSACTDDNPQPRREASTESPTPTPATSNPAPTSDPPASDPAKDETAAGFLRRWQDVNATMQRTGDTKPFRQLGWDCDSCDQLADQVEAIYGPGGHITDAESTMHGLHMVGRSGKVVVFEFKLRSGTSRVVDASGEVTQYFDGGTEQFQINVRRRAGEWRVLRVTRLAA